MLNLIAFVLFASEESFFLHYAICILFYGQKFKKPSHVTSFSQESTILNIFSKTFTKAFMQLYCIIVFDFEQAVWTNIFCGKSRREKFASFNKQQFYFHMKLRHDHFSSKFNTK